MLLQKRFVRIQQLPKLSNVTSNYPAYYTTCPTISFFVLSSHSSLSFSLSPPSTPFSLYTLPPPSRVESYSCRMAGNDKKLYKQLSHQEGQGSSNPQALSPPQTFVGSPITTISSPTTTGVPPVFVRMTSNSSVPGKNSGPQLCDTISSKTLFYLRSTLTASFQPDYDFTDAKSEEFSREPNVKLVKDAVRANLSALVGDMFVSLEPQLWAAIDEEIKLSDCDIYRYSVIPSSI